MEGERGGLQPIYDQLQISSFSATQEMGFAHHHHHHFEDNHHHNQAVLSFLVAPPSSQPLHGKPTTTTAATNTSTNNNNGSLGFNHTEQLLLNRQPSWNNDPVLN